MVVTLTVSQYLEEGVDVVTLTTSPASTSVTLLLVSITKLHWRTATSSMIDYFCEKSEGASSREP